MICIGMCRWIEHCHAQQIISGPYGIHDLGRPEFGQVSNNHDVRVYEENTIALLTDADCNSFNLGRIYPEEVHTCDNHSY